MFCCIQRGMFQEVLSLDPDGSADPSDLSLDEVLAAQYCLQRLIGLKPSELANYTSIKVHVYVRIYVLVCAWNMFYWMPEKFGLCMNTSTYRCVYFKKKMCFSRQNLSRLQFLCVCLPRSRPVGYGATRINTVGRRKAKKIKPHMTAQTNTTLRRQLRGQRHSVYNT